MKGKINHSGNLEIYRVDRFKEMQCPLMDSGIVYCGDWCALFGGIFSKDKVIGPGLGQYVLCLPLCHKTIEFTEFTDERRAAQ
jgi:hypothetical protein